jgi:putative transcriptional regulator
MQDQEGYLTGQLLIAMPGMRDPRFARSVVYLCAHNAEGAMGLVVNKLIDSLSFDDLLQQLGIERRINDSMAIHFGGPVESGRGFVLHSADYLQDSTLQVDERIALTATLDVLRDIARGQGPRQRLFALGYAGWGPGQLDGEMRRHGWYAAEGRGEILFDTPAEDRWTATWKAEGIDPALLSNVTGSA